MRGLDIRFVISLLLLLNLIPQTAAAERLIVTPSDVYTQALIIEQETLLFKRHFNIQKPANEVIELATNISPRHVWQEGYMLQMKLIMFRHKHLLNVLSPVVIEPAENIESYYTFEQTLRILSEIRILKKILGIPGEVPTISPVTDKKPVDVFNKLVHIEAEWDTMLGTGLDASYVFDQVWRLNEDIDSILRQLNIFDNAVPPAKNAADTPYEALEQAFLVLEQVQRLQKSAGLDTVNLSGLRKSDKTKVTPDDSFNLICLILAEVQQIKARIGLNHLITPVAAYHENKTPADVRQFLGYVTNKLILIEHL